MHAIRISEQGGPEVMHYSEIEQPTPGPGQALVKIKAAGINFIDVYKRSGVYPVPTPFTPGEEAAGVVEAIGPDVTEVKVGDRVAYTSQIGSYAEYSLVSAKSLVQVPDGIEDKVAAAAMLQGMTAHYLCNSTYPVQAGDTVVVHAGAGGVGLLLTQMVKMRGGRVISTVSTEEKASLSREAGADEVVLYTQTDFEKEVRRLTDGKGVACVYDSVGKTTFDQSLNSLRPRGYMVLYGGSSGQVPPFNPQILSAKGSLFLTRPTLVSYIATREELLQRAGEVLGWIASGKLNLRVEHVYPLSDAAQAHRDLEGRATTGKLVLIPS